VTDFGAVLTDSPLIRAVHFDASEIGKGATAPTDATIGTTPAVPALLFDATNETAVIYISFRPDMDLTQDMTIKVQWALVNVQLNADQLDVTMDYVIPVVGTTGSGPDKASTQLTPTQQVTTGEGLAINDMYQLEATLSAGDATNPFAGGSAIALEFRLTNVTGVAAIHVLDADLEYVALY
jgi:hypothetical protein